MVKQIGQVACIFIATIGLLTACGSPASTAQPNPPPALQVVTNTPSGAITAAPGSSTVNATMAATAGGTLTTLTAAAVGSSAPTVTGALITPNTSSTKVTSPATATMAATTGNAPAGGATMAATSGMVTTSTGATMAATMAGTSASPCPVQITPMSATDTTLVPVTGTANATGIGTANAGGAYLGIVGQTVPGCGVLIAEIRAGSAAQVDRLQVGDIIVSVDKETVQSNETLAAILSRHAAGDRIQITVLRNNQPQQIGVTLMAGSAATVTVPAKVTPLGTAEPSTPAR